MSSSVLKRYDAVLGAIDRVISWVIIVAMAVLTFVVVLQVFFRYVLNDSLVWGWDVPRLCFIWVVLLSIPLGIRYNAHVGIDLVFNLFPHRTQRFVRIVNALFMLLLSVVAGYWGVVLAFNTWDQMMPGLQLSVGLFYVGLFVGQFHTCLHVLRIILTGETTSEFLSET
jgi:TRAP-type C4-dicarboxylate transport system permease small subunit